MTFKKTFLSLLALVTMGGSAMADDKPVITVDDIEALPGETVSFYVNLSGGKDNTYKGMVLYAYSTQAGFTLTDVTAASEWGAAGIVGVINPTEGNPSISVNTSKALPSGTTDNLLEVKIEVDNSVALGDHVIRLEKIALRYFDAEDKPCEDIADDVTFTVKVVDYITLDENSTKAIANANDAKVKVKRSIKANSWSTICLPFAMTEEQVTSAFGAGVLVKDFTSWSSGEDEDGNIISITIGFTPVTAMDANHPYLIKVAEEITYEKGFTVNNVNIEVEDEPNKRVGSKSSERGWFYGTYQANTKVPEFNLFINNNKFYYSTGKTKIKAFRGFFELRDVLTAVEEGTDARINMIDDQTTGVTNVRVQILNGDYYDLQGRKVENPKKGLYINNGKKVVVK